MPFNPIYGLWSAVNHPVKGSSLKLLEAVKCFTLDAAYSAFEENVKGSLEPGKLADIAILSEDVTAIPAIKIRDVNTEATIVGGKVLYKRAA
jgi:predicted amidohydrolase YtcJ